MSTELDLKTLAVAAQWYVDLIGGGEATREAHQQWLRDDPRHAQAWRRVEKLQTTFGQLDPRAVRPALQSSRAKRRAVLKVLALLIGTSGLLGIGTRTEPWRRMMADYATGTGERLPVTLADGSSLVLNTGTALDVSFDDSLRQVVLREGEVFIQTAPDPLARPFIVRTAFGDLRALGTRFLVRLHPTGARVSVLEHAVEWRSPLPGSPPVRINAGQHLAFAPRAAGEPVPLAAPRQAGGADQCRPATGLLLQRRGRTGASGQGRRCLARQPAGGQRLAPGRCNRRVVPLSERAPGLRWPCRRVAYFREFPVG